MGNLPSAVEKAIRRECKHKWWRNKSGGAICEKCGAEGFFDDLGRLWTKREEL